MPIDQYVQVGTHRARYWLAGNSGPAVVLLHGIGCSVLEWERNIEALASRHRVFVPDLLGFGLTDKPPGERYDIRCHSRFVLDFLSALNVQRAHFAGNSLGGRIALDCAIFAPKRVASLLLVDPAGVGDDRRTLLEFRLATVPWLGEVVTHANPVGTRMLWRKAFADPDTFVTDELVRTKVSLARLPGAQAAFLKTLRGFVGPGGFKQPLLDELHAALPQVRAPALVVWGREDRLVPPVHAHTLQRLMPDVELQLWERCGHAPQVECAERFNATALAFWARLAQTA